MDFRIELEAFRGPLDLLLYLVRKEELEIREIPIAKITDQFLDYLEVVRELQVDDAGEFLELASTLVEIKSRMVLPQAESDPETIEDPREELVERLLEYKKYKDAAALLDDRGRDWQLRYPRSGSDLPPRRVDPSEQPIAEVELWDLVSALGRMLRDREKTGPANIVYDDTPLQVYMQRIHAKLTENRRVAFSEMFAPGMHKSAMVGVFLAVLELVRHSGVNTDQNEGHGEIWITPGERFQEEFRIGESAGDVDRSQPRADSNSA